jgi:hypothetical protein
VVKVYATGGNRGAEHIREAGDVDTASALLALDDTIAVISNSRHGARVADPVEDGLIDEACTLSLPEHRPVQLEEVRT